MCLLDEQYKIVDKCVLLQMDSIWTFNLAITSISVFEAPATA